MVSKNKYLLIFLFASSFLFAQKATVINITRAELKKAYVLSDLIKDIPKDCKVQSYKLALVVKGVEKSMEVIGDVLEPLVKTNTEMVKERFFIEKIKSNCTSKHKQSYKIIIE